MPLREFTDSTGKAWKVWDVHPGKGNDRPDQERRNPDPILLYRGEERRSGKDGRARNAYRRIIPLNEWLAFESGDEKRRLSPIPAGWQDKSDAELEELVRAAERVDRTFSRN